MADIFLGYAHEDAETARLVADALTRQGWDVFWDYEIRAGQPFDKQINAEIDTAGCVVVLWSQASKASDWVRAEALAGRDRSVLVPVFIESMTAPVPFNLIKGVELIDWEGDEDDPGFARLVEAVEQNVMRLVQKWRDDRSRVEFALIEPGEFEMGSLENGDEGPIHSVRIPRRIFLAKTPVTFFLWELFQDELSNEIRVRVDKDALAHPALGARWSEAKAFCTYYGYRLPSEAEWEYACRAGTKTRYWTGDSEEDLARVGWFDRNSCNQTHPVGKKPANDFGLHDVHGNVWEWCEDTWHDSYVGAPDDGSAWVSEDNEFRVLRGGSFDETAGRACSAFRDRDFPESRFRKAGFRPALDIEKWRELQEAK